MARFTEGTKGRLLFLASQPRGLSCLERDTLRTCLHREGAGWQDPSPARVCKCTYRFDFQPGEREAVLQTCKSRAFSHIEVKTRYKHIGRWGKHFQTHLKSGGTERASKHLFSVKSSSGSS